MKFAGCQNLQPLKFQQLALLSSVIFLSVSSDLILHLRILLGFIVFESNRGIRRCLTCKTTKNSYKMSSVMKPGPNVSIELLKLISIQKAHKTCHKQASKLHYFSTNHQVGWNEECDEALLTIKQYLVEPPVLVSPEAVKHSSYTWQSLICW